jgi:ubiquinone/menaquinone biosynthesis C-methylase UbiE
MGKQINLLRSLPETKRDVERRKEAKDPAVVAKAKEYGAEYFDGDRKYGYGGYRYDGRWEPVARDILQHYGLIVGSNYYNVLDVGCAKGFLVYDLWLTGALVESYGLDVSRYALMNCHPDVVGRLHLGSAHQLNFPDNSFDLVLSINTLHNLPRQLALKALKEIMRVSKGPAFIQVDSYDTPEQKERFEDWVLTAEFHGYPDDWLQLFSEAGYEGDYDWTVV